MTSLSDYLSEIDQITKEFTNAFSNLDVETLNHKASPGTWSIAQNIEHLIRINETYYPIIESIRNKTYVVPFFGRLPFMIRFFGNFILKSVGPDRKKKIKTFPLWEPSKSAIGVDILNQFKNHQEDLKQLIVRSEDLMKSNVVISSPANRNIVYTINDAFRIIIAHEKRHFEQAKEVLLLIRKKTAMA